MISTLSGGTWLDESDRILVVAPRGRTHELVQSLRGLYPDRSINGCDSYLSAIAELCRRPVDAVLAGVDASLSQMPSAVAGLREAAGEKTRLILCCPTEHEPLTRRLLNHGADDYVLIPLEGNELDSALGYVRSVSPPSANIPPSPEATTDELDRLSDAVAAIGARPRELLNSLAQLLCASLKARCATVVAEGAVVASGDTAEKPILTAPLLCAGRGIGSVSLAARTEGTYGPADVRRLEQYAGIIGRLLDAASQQRRWRRLAMTDDCTGLPNRRFLHERMRDVLGRAAGECLLVTLLLFDIDNFKAYNDAHGHDAGDEILRLTGELFRKHCREQDIVTRYGGDEFAVVFWDPDGPRMPGSKHPDCALAVLDRFREALLSQKLAKRPPHGDAPLTISGGLATYPWAGDSLSTLLARADQALLAAKRSGRNRILLVSDTNLPPV